MTDFVRSWPIAFFCLLAVGCLALMAAVLHQAKFRPKPVVLAVWSLWGLWVSLSPVWFRLNTQLDGQIISAQDIPPTLGPRYTTRYTLRRPDGKEVEYVAGPAGGSLPRSMPVGTLLNKPKWTIYYDVDGKRYEAGAPWFSIIFASISCGCLIWSIRAKIVERDGAGL